MLCNGLSAPLEHVGVDDVRRGAGGKGDDLVEDVGELQVVFLARDVADVLCTDDVVESKQIGVDVGERLPLVDINGCASGAAHLER